MTRAISALELAYTYSIIIVPSEKQAARRQIGGMAADILRDMRARIMHHAVIEYLRAGGVTQAELKGIGIEDGSL